MKNLYQILKSPYSKTPKSTWASHKFAWKLFFVDRKILLVRVFQTFFDRSVSSAHVKRFAGTQCGNKTRTL